MYGVQMFESMLMQRSESDIASVQQVHCEKAYREQQNSLRASKKEIGSMDTSVLLSSGSAANNAVAAVAAVAREVAATNSSTKRQYQKPLQQAPEEQQQKKQQTNNEPEYIIDEDESMSIDSVAAQAAPLSVSLATDVLRANNSVFPICLFGHYRLVAVHNILNAVKDRRTQNKQRAKLLLIDSMQRNGSSVDFSDVIALIRSTFFAQIRAAIRAAHPEHSPEIVERILSRITFDALSADAVPQQSTTSKELSGQYMVYAAARFAQNPQECAEKWPQYSDNDVSSFWTAKIAPILHLPPPPAPLEKERRYAEAETSSNISSNAAAQLADCEFHPSDSLQAAERYLDNAFVIMIDHIVGAAQKNSSGSANSVKINRAAFCNAGQKWNSNSNLTKLLESCNDTVCADWTRNASEVFGSIGSAISHRIRPVRDARKEKSVQKNDAPSERQRQLQQDKSMAPVRLFNPLVNRHYCCYTNTLVQLVYHGMPDIRDALIRAHLNLAMVNSSSRKACAPIVLFAQILRDMHMRASPVCWSTDLHYWHSLERNKFGFGEVHHVYAWILRRLFECFPDLQQECEPKVSVRMLDSPVNCDSYGIKRKMVKRVCLELQPCPTDHGCDHLMERLKSNFVVHNGSTAEAESNAEVAFSYRRARECPKSILLMPAPQYLVLYLMRYPVEYITADAKNLLCNLPERLVPDGLFHDYFDQETPPRPAAKQPEFELMAFDFFHGAHDSAVVRNPNRQSDFKWIHLDDHKPLEYFTSTTETEFREAAVNAGVVVYALCNASASASVGAAAPAAPAPAASALSKAECKHDGIANNDHSGAPLTTAPAITDDTTAKLSAQQPGNVTQQAPLQKALKNAIPHLRAVLLRCAMLAIKPFPSQALSAAKLVLEALLNDSVQSKRIHDAALSHSSLSKVSPPAMMICPAPAASVPSAPCVPLFRRVSRPQWPHRPVAAVSDLVRCVLCVQCEAEAPNVAEDVTYGTLYDVYVSLSRQNSPARKKRLAIAQELRQKARAHAGEMNEEAAVCIMEDLGGDLAAAWRSLTDFFSDPSDAADLRFGLLLWMRFLRQTAIVVRFLGDSSHGQLQLAVDMTAYDQKKLSIDSAMHTIVGWREPLLVAESTALNASGTYVKNSMVEAESNAETDQLCRAQRTLLQRPTMSKSFVNENKEEYRTCLLSGPMQLLNDSCNEHATVTISGINKEAVESSVLDSGRSEKQLSQIQWCFARLRGKIAKKYMSPSRVMLCTEYVLDGDNAQCTECCAAMEASQADGLSASQKADPNYVYEPSQSSSAMSTPPPRQQRRQRQQHRQQQHRQQPPQQLQQQMNSESLSSEDVDSLATNSDSSADRRKKRRRLSSSSSSGASDFDASDEASVCTA